MGKSMYCDLCRKEVAIEEALKPVSIGENVVCEVCLNCASQLEQGLKKQIAEAETAVIMAKKAAQAPAPQAPQAPEPAKEPATQADIKAKIAGADKNG